MPKSVKKPVKVTNKAVPSISKTPAKPKAVAMAPKAAASKSKKPTKAVAAPAKKTGADAKAGIKGKLKAVGEMIFGKDAPAKNAKGAKAAAPAKGGAKGAASKSTVVVETTVTAKSSKSEKVVAVLATSTKTSAKGKSAKSGVYLDNGEKMCRETGCENIASTKGYCRLDYIKNWKKIKRKEMILKEGKLNNYIDELISKYPDKYVEIIRQDLSSEVNFNKVVHDLELDESIDDLDYDGDSIDALIGGIRKDTDDIDDTDF